MVKLPIHHTGGITNIGSNPLELPYDPLGDRPGFPQYEKRRSSFASPLALLDPRKKVKWASSLARYLAPEVVSTVGSKAKDLWRGGEELYKSALKAAEPYSIKALSKADEGKIIKPADEVAKKSLIDPLTKEQLPLWNKIKASKENYYDGKSWENLTANHRSSFKRIYKEISESGKSLDEITLNPYVRKLDGKPVATPQLNIPGQSVKPGTVFQQLPEGSEKYFKELHPNKSYLSLGPDGRRAFRRNWEVRNKRNTQEAEWYEKGGILNVIKNTVIKKDGERVQELRRSNEFMDLIKQKHKQLTKVGPNKEVVLPHKSDLMEAVGMNKTTISRFNKLLKDKNVNLKFYQDDPVLAGLNRKQRDKVISDWLKNPEVSDYDKSLWNAYYKIIPEWNKAFPNDPKNLDHIMAFTNSKNKVSAQTLDNLQITSKEFNENIKAELFEKTGSGFRQLTADILGTKSFTEKKRLMKIFHEEWDEYVKLVDDAGHFIDTTRLPFMPKSKQISTKKNVGDKLSDQIDHLRKELDRHYLMDEATSGIMSPGRVREVYGFKKGGRVGYKKGGAVKPKINPKDYVVNYSDGTKLYKINSFIRDVANQVD